MFQQVHLIDWATKGVLGLGNSQDILLACSDIIIAEYVGLLRAL